MFDTSTAALFAHALGMRKAQMLATYGIVGIPMVDTRARFSVPCAFGDGVEIESKRSSFDVQHRLLKEGTLAVEGFEMRVWVGHHPDDPKRNKAQEIPREGRGTLLGNGIEILKSMRAPANPPSSLAEMETPMKRDEGDGCL